MTIKHTLLKHTVLSCFLPFSWKKGVSLFSAIFILFTTLCLLIDQGISFYVRDKVYANINDIPYRPYALVLGTSKYIATGRTNLYYDYRLDAAKNLLEQKKISYLLLSGDNRTPQYNEPRAMFRDLRKMGISESIMFRDFAGFRTLDSVIRAHQVFKVKQFTIVSQKFHCERALFIAKYYNIDAICFTANQPDTFNGMRVREIFARVRAVFDLIIGVQPYFLGKPEPLPSLQ